jgi:hypothetical protein
MGLSRLANITKVNGQRLTEQTDLIRYAVVSVFTAGGAFDREFQITPAEYAALGQPDAGVPAGVQAGESCVVEARRLDLGDMERRADGSAALLTRKQTTNGRTFVTLLTLAAGEFSGTGAAITAVPGVLDGVTGAPLSIHEGIVVG